MTTNTEKDKVHSPPIICISYLYKVTFILIILETTLQEFKEKVGILHSFKNYNSEESTTDSGQYDELNEVDKDTETQVTRKRKRKLVCDDNE